MSITNKNLARVHLGNRIEIAEGWGTQQAGKYEPTVINTVDGASQTKDTGNFHSPTRRRQLAKGRAEQYVNDKGEEKRTDDWMAFFNNPQFDVG